MSSKKVFEIANGVYFTSISSNEERINFKKNLFSLNFLVPLDTECVGANALITKILTNSCKKFPDFTSFNKRLEELYGAIITSDVQKVGETQVLSFYAVFIDDKFVFDNTKISAEICKLLCEIIFNPNADSKKFDERVFEQERRQLVEQIEAEFNDKQVYARKRCIEEMCREEKFGISRFGSSKNVEKLKNEEVFIAWKNLLEHAKVEIMFVGDSCPGEIVDILKENFVKIRRENILKNSVEVIRSAEKIREISDKMDVKQSKLIMGFRTDIAEPDDDTAGMYMMTMILGGTPFSKLFLNVREKMSLCYYCSASYDKIKGILMISSGVDHSNILKAKQEILKQLDEIKYGNVTNDEFIQTKDLVIQAISKIKDSIFKIESFEITQKITGRTESIDDYMARVQAVTKDQTIDAAKRISLDTVYVLTERSDV